MIYVEKLGTEGEIIREDIDIATGRGWVPRDNCVSKLKTFETFVNSKLHHFMFNNYQRQRAKRFEIV